MKKELKVFTSEEEFVPDFEALAQGKLRFIGRKMDPSLGQEKNIPVYSGKDSKDVFVTQKQGGWRIKEEFTTIPYRAEYVEALRKGCLLPADAETARLVGLSKVYSFEK